MEIRVLNGHELADLVGEDQIFEAADLNGIGITEALVPGVTLTIPKQPAPQLTLERRQRTSRAAVKRVVAGQTWVDIVLQELGDELRLFELCDLNDAGITDDLAPSTVVQAPEADASKATVVNTLRARKPASIHYGTGDAQPEGIEFWAIEFDFVVS